MKKRKRKTQKKKAFHPENSSPALSAELPRMSSREVMRTAMTLMMAQTLCSLMAPIFDKMMPKEEKQK